MPQTIVAQEQVWRVPLTALRTDTPLRYDLIDDQGRLLVKMGRRVSQGAIDYLVGRKISWLAIDPMATAPSEDQLPESRYQTRAVDTQAQQRLQTCFKSSMSLLQTSVGRIIAGEPTDARQAEETLKFFVDEAEKDLAVALTTIFDNQASQQIDLRTKLAQRSVKLSFLATSMAIVMGYQNSDLMAIGSAGLYHDMALMGEAEMMEYSHSPVNFCHSNTYLQHALVGARLAESIQGMLPLCRLLMGQVHEELDGNGFPLGLRSVRIHQLAKVLNVAQIYLALTQPLMSRQAILPADAMSFLLSHANQHRLCPKSVQALILAASIYPVGSEVLLEDNSIAKVVRACPERPLQPTIFIPSRGQRLVDLRYCPIQIVGPIARQKDRGEIRLKASQLKQRIWREDYLH